MDINKIITELKKNLKIYEEESEAQSLFNIGYYYGKLEVLIPKKRRIKKDQFIKYIINEEFLKINEYLDKNLEYYYDTKAKYSF